MLLEQKPKSSNLAAARLILAAVVLISFVVLILSVNFAYAVIIDGGHELSSFKSLEELTRDILTWILGLMATISLPIFLIGVYKFFKGKKRQEIKILSFVLKIVFSFILSGFFLILYLFFLLIIIFKISIFYNFNNLNTLGWIFLVSLYIIGIYAFAKWLLGTLKLNFFIMFSILLFNIAEIIYILTTAITYGPMI